MLSEKEIKSLLVKVTKITQRIQLLKNPPESHKMENCHYRMLLSQQQLLSYILGDNGFEYDEAYDAYAKHLDSIEGNS